MSYLLPPWETGAEPNASNVRQFCGNLYTKLHPLDSYRWNEGNTDTLFYAGNHSYINRYYNFAPAAGVTNNNFNFPLLQLPVQMVTGFQRQNRKSINYIPSEGADPHTTDQYTRLMTHLFNTEGLNEQYSKACELAAVSGMVLLQPYLDYMGEDPAQGNLKLKIWEYNAFMMDPFYRDASGADAQVFWCQEYISKREAEDRFPGQVNYIAPMSGTPQRNGNFYFLPESYNMYRNDLMILSYIWYKWKRKKKRLYSEKRNQFFDFTDDGENLDQILYNIPDLQIVEVETPTWKLATILNDQLMYQGLNPLGFDDCPFIPVFWNYEPHISQPELRVRSLITPLRSSQFLFSRRIILNHDISEATINAGWKRKIGAVANEDNLKKAGQGYDIIINDGYEMTDVDKIIPSGVPESDLALAEQMQNLIFATSGVNIENWSAQEDKNASSLTVLLKQGANLMVLQKFFDQWDYSFKLLGDKCLKIVLNNWNAAKAGMLLGEEPSPHFFSKIFAKYQVVVEEGLNTAIQKQQEFMQLLELNQMVGGVIPPSYIISKATIQGKNELMEMMQQQEQQAQAVQSEETNIKHAFEEAKLQELMSKAALNVASAKERYGRFESNIGLLEERISEISKNRALSTKSKMEALEKMIDVIQRYGEIETMLKMNQIESFDYNQKNIEDSEKNQAYREAQGNEFVSKMMSGIGGGMGAGAA